eukprot:5147061-Pyramimonas_sp.AAC.1
MGSHSAPRSSEAACCSHKVEAQFSPGQAASRQVPSFAWVVNNIAQSPAGVVESAQIPKAITRAVAALAAV